MSVLNDRRDAFVSVDIIAELSYRGRSYTRLRLRLRHA